MSDDRTVHAKTVRGTEVVRYDRAGKWFVEGVDGWRHRVSLADAVRLATQPDAEVFLGRPGGGRFDAAGDAPARRLVPGVARRLRPSGRAVEARHEGPGLLRMTLTTDDGSDEMSDEGFRFRDTSGEPFPIGEAWECPRCGLQFAIGTTGRLSPPQCSAGHESVEMEQVLPKRFTASTDPTP